MNIFQRFFLHSAAVPHVVPSVTFSPTFVAVFWGTVGVATGRLYESKRIARQLDTVALDTVAKLV
jgi:hypothetical protein